MVKSAHTIRKPFYTHLRRAINLVRFVSICCHGASAHILPIFPNKYTHQHHCTLKSNLDQERKIGERDEDQLFKLDQALDHNSVSFNSLHCTGF